MDGGEDRPPVPATEEAHGQSAQDQEGAEDARGSVNARVEVQIDRT
jgi:hypothetical protein